VAVIILVSVLTDIYLYTGSSAESKICFRTIIGGKIFKEQNLIKKTAATVTGGVLLLLNLSG
jgi:hypothetical protein